MSRFALLASSPLVLAVVRLESGSVTGSPWTVLKGINDVGTGSVKGKWEELPELVNSAVVCQTAATDRNVSIFSWNMRSHHCYLRVDQVWAPMKNSRTISGCLPSVPGCPNSPRPPPPPPSPSPPLPPSPRFRQTSVKAPQPHLNECGISPQGAGLMNTAYFLPTSPVAGSALISYNVSSTMWSSVRMDPRVSGMLRGGSMTSVGPEWLVVSGGGTSSVMSYSIIARNWTAQKPLLHKIENSCSVGCRGRLYTMTGDFKKKGTATDQTFKPTDRQIYSYNLTDGTVFQNNGEKTRGGAGCACGAEAGDVFFAGGFSDSGITSGVEVWRYPLARRGEPKLDMGQKKRDLGGVGCGEYVIFAGGTDGKKVSDTVEVWPTVFNTTVSLKPLVYKITAGLRYPKIGCLGSRYALIGGGIASDGRCARDVYALDTWTMPPQGVTLPTVGTLSGGSPGGGTAGAVAVATLSTGAVAYFDGATLDLFQIMES